MSIGYPSKTSPMISNRSQQIHCQFLTALAASIAPAWLWDHWITFEAFYLGLGSFSEGGGSRYLAVCFTTSSQNSKALLAFFLNPSKLHSGRLYLHAVRFRTSSQKKLKAFRGIWKITPQKKRKKRSKKTIGWLEKIPPSGFQIGNIYIYIYRLIHLSGCSSNRHLSFRGVVVDWFLNSDP